MLIKTKAIVLSALKYQEKSLIVKCYTLNHGIQSYFVPSAFSSKKSNQRIAYFQPLNCLEIEATHKNKGTLEHFKEVKLAHTYQTIYSDISKSTIALFLSEILHHSILEEEKNENLFAFLETALLWFDTHKDAFNFHIIVLVELTKHLGFYPDCSEISFPFFDKIEGRFVAFQGMSALNEHETNLFKKLLNLKFDSDQKIFVGVERQILLKILLDFYALHLDGFKKPKSLDILTEVFS